MNLLFICSRNQWRSPTAEKIFSSYPYISARSAGTSSKARVKINFKLLDWADVVFVMEKKHRELIKQRFPDLNKKIIVLDIEDNYQFMDEELIEILKREVEPYLK